MERRLVRPARHGQGLEAEFEVPEGSHHDLVLEVANVGFHRAPPDPDRVWASTEHAWQQPVPEMDMTIAPADARHSYAVLRGMTSTSGDMVAAATMSLPERAQESRNYDFATLGSAIFAMPARRSRPVAGSLCWTTRSGSSPNGSWLTVRG